MLPNLEHAPHCQAVDLHGWSGLVAPGLNPREAARSTLELMDRCLSGQGEVLYKGRNCIRTFSPGEHPVGDITLALKIFAPPGPRRKLESLLKSPKARRAFISGSFLTDRGISTPTPLVTLERRKGFMLQQEVIAFAKHVDGVEFRKIRHNTDGTFDGVMDSDFAVELAGFLRDFHKTGALHRDLSDGNLLVELGGEHPRFILLDLNRMRIRRNLSRLRALGDTIRLGLCPRIQADFVHAYTDGWGGRWSYRLYRLLRKRFLLWHRLKFIRKLKWLKNR